MLHVCQRFVGPETGLSERKTFLENVWRHHPWLSAICQCWGLGRPFCSAQSSVCSTPSLAVLGRQRWENWKENYQSPLNHWGFPDLDVWLERTLQVCLGYCNTCFIRPFLAWSGKLGDLHVSSGILSATFPYWLLLPKAVVLSPFFPFLPLQIACLHSEPAQLLCSQTAPVQRKWCFCWIKESNQFISEGQLQGGCEIALCRLRNGEGSPAWWCRSSVSADSELCPKHSFLGIHQDANSVKPVL